MARKASTGQLVQTERLHTLGQLVAGVVHELNNPLTIVGTNLRVMAEYTEALLAILAAAEADGLGPKALAAAEEHDLAYLREDLPRLLGSVQDGSQRAAQLVDELRRYSISQRPEVGLVDLKSVLNSTVRLVASTYRLKVRFAVDLERCPPILGVPGQIQQVFMNLMINACQAMLANGGELRVRSQAEGEGTLVEVADTGPGIPTDLLEKVFEPYFSTKSPSEGTGLGLPITKRIVEKHGGKLELASTPGQGTRFTVWLPSEPPESLQQDPSLPYEVT